MAADAGSYHVQVYVDNAPNQMLSRFDGYRMITVFPECALPVFSLIVFLPGAAGDQLHGSGDAAPACGIQYQEMDVIGGNHIVQDRETVTLAGLKQPSHTCLGPTLPPEIPSKAQIPLSQFP